MLEDFNLIRNWRFRDGAARPRSWTWSANGDGFEWTRSHGGDSSQCAIVLTSRVAHGTGVWTQRIRSKSKQWYRIEADVTCDCAGDDEHAGAGIWVRPVVDGRPVGDPLRLTGALRSTGPLTLRSFYRAAHGVRSLEIRVGLSDACGSVTVHSVLAVPILDPEVTCHVLTLPPPPYAYRSPRKVKTICVCDERGAERPLLSILGKRFGQRSVSQVHPSDLEVDSLRSHALIISGARPPKAVRSLSALMRLANKRLVVVSTEAFAKIVGGGLSVRTIEQPDEPMHAKVCWANFITRGFALHDIFPFSGTSGDGRGYVQRQFRKGPTLTRLRRRYEFETVLQSMTDSDSTSEQSISLYKPTDGGGIVVLDTEPIEVLPSTGDESNIAAFVLFNALGAEQTSLGQYIVPEEEEGDWYKTINEFVQRFPVFHLSGRDRHEMLVRLGADEESFGLPMTKRPVILIRTGLRGDDLAGVYSTMIYLKHLVRPEPYATAYTSELIKRFRLAWIPLVGPWQPRHWDAALAAQQVESAGQFDAESIAAVIDITDSPVQDLRVVYDRQDAEYHRQERLLRALSQRFSAGRYFYRAPAASATLARRDTMSWRFEELVPKVIADGAPFDTELHRNAAAAGARLIRIEVPGGNTNLVCNSIWRTDLIATTLEHVIGLQLGMVAMNRNATPVAFEDYPPIGAGESICVVDGQAGNLATMRAG